ncbi:hypothetical protein BRC83_07040 [Halobacteriales archaeon QS_1_68_17]|nr:MAG: hypothetical protein BRC83_07040 [Halobacteriales archaeon QS_1_68_17]
MAGPLDRVREEPTGATALLLLALGLTALFLGVDNFWIIFAVGYGAVVPLVSFLTGDDEGAEPREEATDEVRQRHADGDAATDEALERLRRRYAEGELTDEQFERKVERLLETETVEDAEDRLRERT